MRTISTALLLLLVPTLALASLAEDLQDVSVTIRTPRGQGSGVLITRDLKLHPNSEDTTSVTMVLTAAHVVASAKSTRSSIVEGETRTITEFEEIDVVKELRQDGRRVGEITMAATVVRYSDAREGDDLALLVLHKRDYSDSSVEFIPGDDIIPIGTHLYHVGSLLGQFGSNSMTDGLLSQVGRTLTVGKGAGTTFDQVSCIAWPGSSGGGVFISDQHEDKSMRGKLVGLLVRGAGNGGGGFAFIVPARRIATWASASDAVWLLDPAAEQPCLDEIYEAPMGAGSEAVGYSGSDVDDPDFLFLDN